MSNVQNYLEKLEFWKELSTDEREYALQYTSIRHYKRGDFVHSCNRQCLGLVYVIKGGIRVYVMSDEGREVTLFRMYEGDACVLASSCVISQINFETEMTAAEDSDVLVMSPGAFAKLAENNIHVKCFMYEKATESFSAVMWSMQQLLFSRLDRRIASYLINECERSGSNEIRKTHEEIAQDMSSAREAVGRMLKRFAADGLVEVRRGKTVITDMEALRNMM